MRGCEELGRSLAEWARRRALLGGELLPDARQILRALRRGAVVGLLVDIYTPQRRGGILVPFSGRRAWAAAGPATLALRTGAPILPVWIRRAAGTRRGTASATSAS